MGGWQLGRVRVRKKRDKGAAILVWYFVFGLKNRSCWTPFPFLIEATEWPSMQPWSLIQPRSGMRLFFGNYGNQPRWASLGKPALCLEIPIHLILRLEDISYVLPTRYRQWGKCHLMVNNTAYYLLRWLMWYLWFNCMPTAYWPALFHKLRLIVGWPLYGFII